MLSSTMSRFRDVASTIGLVGMMGLALAASGAQAPATQPPTGQQPPPKTEARPAQDPAAGQAKPGQAPVFRAGVNFVRVDVIVTDRDGKAVMDLAQGDFDIYEDGKLQAIDLFRLVNTDGNPAPGADRARAIRTESDQELEAARDDVRLFVIFLDDYHVRMQNSMRVRDPLVQFVNNELGPLDMVALMYPLTPVTALTFTRDKDELVRAIRKFEGRKFNYTPRNVFEQKYANYPTQTVETLRNEVTIDALKGLPVRLGSLREGRKAVILVSEGFVGLLPPQMRDSMAGMPGTAVASDPRTEDRARFASDMDLQQQLRDVYDAANRNNTAIYTLDPRGLATGEYEMNENVGQRLDMDTLRSSQDTLRVLASETDGRAIINRNDLASGLKQVVRDTSAYYLCGYNSSLATPDGKFHKIEVKLKRPGLQVRARKGYWAPTAEEAAKAAAPPKPRPPAAVERALSAVETTPKETTVVTWVGTARGENGRTRVTFAWEPVPLVPGEKRQEPVRVALTVGGPNGEPYFKGFVPETAASTEVAGPPALAVGPRPASKVTFEARPGKVQIRTSIQDAAGQVMDGTQQDYLVPDFTADKVQLSTPVVLSGRTPRELQALSRDPDPAPTAARLFRRTDRLLIRFSAYGAHGKAPEVTVRLLNRVGQKMSDIPVKVSEGIADLYLIDLPLAGLSPGEYVIEVKAMGEGGEATELIAIRVTS